MQNYNCKVVLGLKTNCKFVSVLTTKKCQLFSGRDTLRLQCCGAATKFKKLDDSIDKPYYDRMHQKLTSNPEYAKKISRIRSRTVEPVLGTMINFLNMKRVNTRGMSSANKHPSTMLRTSVLLSAMCYNLKKLMKFNRPKLEIVTQALQKETLKVGELMFFLKQPYQKQIFQF
jgi:hypothetical protein